MFIVAGIDESTVFETQTRKEIGAIEWVPFSDLPTWTHKKGPKRTGGKGQKRFYNVTPFVGPLKKWLSKHGYNPHPPRRKEKPVGRELKPFAFDDAPAKAHPTTALDHLFAKFIEKDETAVALESDNARTLDRLFGSLEVSDGSHAQTQQQRSDDDALTKLLSGIGHVSAPPPAPQLQPAQALPEKQSKFLSVLNQKPAPAPLTPPRSTHQTNLLSMLASPPKVAQHDPTPPPSSHQGNLLNMLSAAPPPPQIQQQPDDQMARQRALLEACFGSEPAATPPPRAVSASSMMSPMPPLPPAEGGWYGQQESALHGPPGTPGYQRLPMPGSPRGPPGIPASPVRGGYPQQQLRQTAIHNAQRYPAPPQQAYPQPQQQAYPQPPQQAYPQPPQQQAYQQPPQPPQNEHQRALLGALFNGRQPPPHMQQQPQQPQQPYNNYQQAYPPPPPQGYPPYPSPGAPSQQMTPQQMPPQQMNYGYQNYPQTPQQPPQPQPQQQQQQQQSVPQQAVPQPNVGPPNPPSPSVHQPVPRPPVGGGLLGLMSR